MSASRRAKRQAQAASRPVYSGSGLTPIRKPKSGVQAAIAKGNTLFEEGKFESAERVFCCVLAVEPNNAETLAHLGACLGEQGRFEEALGVLQRAWKIDPDNLLAMRGVSNAFRALGQYAKAVVVADEAVSKHPMSAAALNCLGLAWGGLGDFQRAAAFYSRAIQIQPGYIEASLNLAAAYLALGDYTRGFPGLKWDLQTKARQKTAGEQLRALGPEWKGEPLRGKTLVLYCDDGLGDAIQFIRYAWLVREIGARILFVGNPLLRELFKNLEGIDEFHAWSDKPVPFDYHCWLLNLPAMLSTTLETVPSCVSYLSAASEHVGYWRYALKHPPGFRIGIAWQGNPKHANDRNRSFPLALFEPLSRIEGVQLVSLQKGYGAEQVKALGGRFPVREVGTSIDPGPSSLENLAAIMANCDLIITLDSMIAHLAGALGCPAWVLLPKVAEWRWLVDRTDSPWYPSLALFRQKTHGDWPEVFGRVAEQVRRNLEPATSTESAP
jgi:Flp pilus assembly protein TadD